MINIINAPHVTPTDRFAANKFSKQQHLQALKPERPLQFSPSHSNYVINLPECIMCKIQYVGKSEISFNFRLSNPAIEACK